MQSGASIHVFIPCHVDSQVRMVKFMRCVKSVFSQLEQHFAVLVGLSGSAEFRENCLNVLRLLAAKRPDVRCFVTNGHEARYQFEHLRDLLDISEAICGNAWLMFLNNDDLFHPRRIEAFKEFVDHPERSAQFGNTPFSVPCKVPFRPLL